MDDADRAQIITESHLERALARHRAAVLQEGRLSAGLRRIDRATEGLVEISERGLAGSST